MGFGKLYTKIFLLFLLALVAAELLVFGLVRQSDPEDKRERLRQFAARQSIVLQEFIQMHIQRSWGDRQAYQRFAERLSELYDSEVWFIGARGRILGASHDNAPPPRPPAQLMKRMGAFYYFRTPREDLYIELPLAGPRGPTRLLALWRGDQDWFGFSIFAALGGVVVAFALLAYPVSRMLGRPLMVLEASARRIADGDLSHRAPVSGSDEIGKLAGSFNEMAERVERMIRGTKELTAHVSHELRSPLARMRVAEELIREIPEVQKNQSVMKYLGSIREEIGDLDVLIGRILLLSRLDAAPRAVTRETVDVKRLCESLLERFGPAMERRELRLGTQLDEITRLAAPEYLQTMLANLLDNAVKFTPAGGEVFVSLRGDAGGGLELCVRNDCETPPNVDRLFEPFYRAPEAAGETSGTGLGLAIVRRIAEHEGGMVAARALEGALEIVVRL